jgi:plastocyanin
MHVVAVGTIRGRLVKTFTKTECEPPVTSRRMRKGGLEPPRVTPLDPKSSASTSSATSAFFKIALTAASRRNCLTSRAFYPPEAVIHRPRSVLNGELLVSFDARDSNDTLVSLEERMTLLRRNTAVLSGLRALSFFAALTVAGSPACGGSGGSGYPTDGSTTGSNTGSNGGSNQGSVTRTNAITVGNNSFSPDVTTVPRGTTVVWTWNACETGYGGQTCTAHSVSFDDGSTSAIQDQGSYSHQFATAGTFKYHCKVHGSSMAGTVTVE